MRRHPLTLLALGAALTACGPSAAPDAPSPDAVSSAIVVSSTSGCRLDDDCAMGRFCFQQRCVSECATDADCPAEATCSERSRCVAATPAPDGAGVSAVDGDAASAVSTDLGGIELTHWPEDSVVTVPPGQPFVEITLTASAPVPKDGFLYTVQLGKDGTREAFQAEGRTEFTLTLPTGTAGADAPETQVVDVVTPMGGRTLYLVPTPPRTGWYAGTFTPPVFGGAGLPLELGVEIEPAGATSLVEAEQAWLWVPTRASFLVSLPGPDEPAVWLRRPLEYDPSIGAWVALFSADALDTQGLFGEDLFPFAERAFRVEISEEDGGTLTGAVADRWRGIFDRRTADGVREPGTAVVSGTFTLDRTGPLPGGEVRDADFLPSTPRSQDAPDLSMCPDSVFAFPEVTPPESAPCEGLGNADVFATAPAAARASCALAISDRVMAGPTVGKILNALLDPTVPDPQGLDFATFIQACASDGSELCKPTPELRCARALVAHAYRDADAASTAVADLSEAYDRTTREAFLGRQLAAFQVDTQTRLEWLRGSEAPPFLASTLRDYNQKILETWRTKVLDAHLSGVFGQLDAAGLAVLTRSPTDPVAISNRQSLLLGLTNSWRAALDALVLLTQRWNVLLQAEGPRAEAAGYVRTTATRLYLTAAILQDLNRETGSSYLGSTFGAGFSVLMRALTRLSLPFDDLVFARDAELVTSRSLDPESNSRSLLTEREELARTAVQDAAASVDRVLDEAQQSEVDEAVLTQRYEDQLLSLRNELISLCGLPTGCTPADVGTDPACDVPTDAGRCGFVVDGGDLAIPAGGQSVSEAGGALYDLQEAALARQEADEALQAQVQKATLMGATADAFARKVAAWDTQRRSVATEVDALLSEITALQDQRLQAELGTLRDQQLLREQAYARQQAEVARWDTIRTKGNETDLSKLGSINALNIASSVLGLGADRVDKLAKIFKDVAPKTAGTTTDPSFVQRLGVRFPAFIASSVALTAATTLDGIASSLEVSLEGEQAIREAQLTHLEELQDLDAMGTENELAALQDLVDASGLRSEQQQNQLNALVDALKRNLDLDMAHDRDLQELADRRDRWRLMLVDVLHFQYAVLQAELTARQKELAYYEVVQRAQLLEGRFRAMQARFQNLEGLLGSPDVVFSFANRMARAESRIDRARGALEEWVVALEYYAVRPFVSQHLAILLARNPAQLEAIANELLRLQRACGGPVTTETVDVSLRDDLLGMGFSAPSGSASERFRALLARAQTPVNRRVPLSTSQTLGERLDAGHVWAANFDLGVDAFANLARTCNAKLDSVAVQLVGEGLGHGQPVVSVVYDGRGQLRSCQPGLEDYVSQFGPEATSFGRVTTFKTAARAIAPVAGLGSYGPSQTWNATLEGLPLAAGYTVLIDLDQPSNATLDWSRLDDVRLQLRFTYQDVFPEGQCK